MTSTQVIYSYTVKQAVEDGSMVLIDQALSSQLYKYPVVITDSVYEIVQKAIANKKHCNDWEGVIWDILWMSRHPEKTDEDMIVFNVIITGANSYSEYKLWGFCQPYDETGAPCITIMLPSDY